MMLTFITVCIFLTQISFTEALACPLPYTFKSGTCLFYSTTSKNWYDARADCHAMRGDLIKVDTAEVANIADTLAQAGGVYWVSVNDILKEGQHYWTDGQTLSWSQWKTDQPNDNGHTQNCVVSLLSQTGWEDKTCSDIYDYICQYSGCQDDATMIMWNDSVHDNVEIVAHFTTADRSECASSCIRRSDCDGVAYDKTLLICSFLILRDGLSGTDLNLANSEVYFLRN